jgi:hypothetical protein
MNKRLMQTNNDGGFEPPPVYNFNTVLYTGNGGTQAITGVGFEPDFVWIKSRNATHDYQFHDSVRGAGNALYSNLTAAEAQLNTVTSFDSDGFTVSQSASLGTNENGTTYVAWCLKAGGATVSNTEGTITSQVSANATAGFSIVEWTGDTNSTATVGHGLDTAPSICFLKGRENGSDSWCVSGSSNVFANPNTEYLMLNAQNPVSSTTANSVGSNTNTINIGFRNYNAQSSIAYCFADVAGFSKFGTYIGAANIEAPTVTVGFEPAYLLVKRMNANFNWFVFDNARNPTNNRNRYLYPNFSNAELQGGSGNYYSFDADSFTVRSTDNSLNASGETYLYMAFGNEF